MSLLFRWITVRCQKCGKVHCETPPGGKVRFKCPRCRTWQVVDT